ncbi:phenylalanine--tRNA ligase subunit alpha [Candidatus Nomurabacteria bacterium RIFCSPHIGHO2_02_FULL_37_13]|uniref:phenylalanine--tRNA ligase n=1 Tax=Candidatus Nomurabacteria bacterium RIFCSPHIGHO2_02_FULL_37_13 TaxID=1801750 RepID=A0A1F6W6M2_9BACT|nr:MAG: phenylalanine--tRNA ligase subunit alpha [Candidatus Nomurabacteria bacterium RIFCSPHIGHO2_01_FULL_36_23]OGI77426.1 MAG: phenylalanine--tRNA ligase subunit alpha [Candidatus Nomurabacteria bacterium RIFCSPHIGHO2_02_FULL_37_13]OGI88638.1 MAG: phenylalanine--tRNA ligase subunit alpha [Candidatus Nomurabacteria bacterium RIFCSPLOWO2_01_FULL_37_25]
MNSEIKKGTEHPLSMVINEAVKIFIDLGFEVATGPELEDVWHNFDALNIPKDHPARDMQDTFFIKDKKESVLRTHTTTVTVRSIEQAGKEERLPCAFISIGKVFRNEATDITHEMQFYQIDGIMVGNIDDDISLADLKGVLMRFYKKMLGENTDIEFRPSFFSFTEPSIEVYVKFNGKWLEMMGAGMIHPNVLRNCGLDPAKVQGFAFGGGLDRIAMIKWGIPDVRLFYQGDLRLNQF